MPHCRYCDRPVDEGEFGVDHCEGYHEPMSGKLRVKDSMGHVWGVVYDIEGACVVPGPIANSFPTLFVTLSCDNHRLGSKESVRVKDDGSFELYFATGTTETYEELEGQSLEDLLDDDEDGYSAKAERFREGLAQVEFALRTFAEHTPSECMSGLSLMDELKEGERLHRKGWVEEQKERFKHQLREGLYCEGLSNEDIAEILTDVAKELLTDAS